MEMNQFSKIKTNLRTVLWLDSNQRNLFTLHLWLSILHSSLPIKIKIIFLECWNMFQIKNKTCFFPYNICFYSWLTSVHRPCVCLHTFNRVRVSECVCVCVCEREWKLKGLSHIPSNTKANNKSTLAKRKQIKPKKDDTFWYKHFLFT